MNEFRNPNPVSKVLTWLSLAVLVWLVYLILRPFLIPLGWAGVLASISYPLHEHFLRRWRPTTAASLTTVAVMLVVIVPGVFVATAFVRETFELAARVQMALADGQLDWVNNSWDSLRDRIPAAANLDLQTMSADALKQGAAYLMSSSGSIFGSVAEFVIDLILALFATFFFLRDADVIMRGVRRLLPMESNAKEALISRTRDLIAAGVMSSAVVAVVQGVLGAISLALVGIGAPVFWGVVTAFACLLPFGAWVVWLPAAVILAASGDVVRGIVLVALGVMVVSTADNVVRPALLSGRTHMNGLVVFVGLLGGLSVFGLLGLVIGPVLVATLLGLLNGHVNGHASHQPHPAQAFTPRRRSG
jgi:predicted PurR-regulated permease PerM